jgi:hypothetical protein
MKEAKKKYQKKLKSKIVTFYLHEEEIYRYAKTINFNGFVKAKLREEMNREKANDERNQNQ